MTETIWDGRTFGDEAILQALVPHDEWAHGGKYERGYVNTIFGRKCSRCDAQRRLGALQGTIAKLAGELSVSRNREAT